MGKLKNSIQYKTINRKALTFIAEEVSNVSNTNLEKKPADVIIEQIDAAGLESEKSAAGKMAVLWKLIAAAKKEILCKILDMFYEVICHASGIPTAFSVPNNTNTIIPFNVLVYTPSTGSYSVAGFTAARSGYYDVDVRFENANLTTPVTQITLLIWGTNGGVPVDEVIMGTEIMRLQGSLKIWCAAGDRIYAALYQNSGAGILFNTLAHPGASGYISISYAGSPKAATF